MNETQLVRQERAVYKQFPFASSCTSRGCSVAIIQKIREVGGQFTVCADILKVFIIRNRGAAEFLSI